MVNKGRSIYTLLCEERNEMEYIIVIDVTRLVWYCLRRKLQNFTQYKLLQTLYWERIWSAQERVNVTAVGPLRNSLCRIEHSQVSLERNLRIRF